MNFLKKIKEKFSYFLWRTIDKISFYINENLRIKLTSFINNLIPDKDITKTSILFYFIAIFCILSIIWGFSARIDMVVRATGEVIPATRVKVIQSVFPGVIEKINIKFVVIIYPCFHNNTTFPSCLSVITPSNSKYHRRNQIGPAKFGWQLGQW